MIGGGKGRRSAKIAVISLSSVGQLTGKRTQRNVYTRERARAARGGFQRACPPRAASVRGVYTCERVARDKKPRGGDEEPRETAAERVEEEGAATQGPEEAERGKCI